MGRFISIFLLFFTFVWAEIDFTKEELEYIKNKKEIIVGGERDWAPFDFVDENGKYEGIANEYLKIISEKSSLKIKLQIDSWSNLISLLKENKIDLLPAIYYSKQREEFAYFTKKYSKHAEFVFVKKGYGDYKSLKDLEGKRVVVVSGYTIEEYLKKKYPKIRVIKASSIIEAFSILLSEKADAFINDIASTSFNLQKYNITGVIPNTLLSDKINNLHMATNRDNKILRDIIQKIFDDITPKRHQAIRNSWISFEVKNQKGIDIEFSEKEKEWIKNHPTIKYTSDPNWMPYEADENGRYIGVFSDILQIVSNKIGIQIKYISSNSWEDVLKVAKNREVDMISAIRNPKREEYLLFTNPHFRKNLSLVTKKDYKIIDSLTQISSEKVALIQGYGYVEEMIKAYPNIKFHFIKNIKEGLEGVDSGKYDIFVLNITSALYSISKHQFDNLKISGSLDIDFEIAFAVRDDWPIFRDIVNKALLTITEDEKQQILNRWVQPSVPKNIDYDLLYKLLIIFTTIILITIYWNRKLQLEIKEKIKTQKELIQEKIKLETVLNKASNMIIVTNGDRIYQANKAFFDFLQIKDINEFYDKYNCLCCLFLKKEGYFSSIKQSDSNQWIQSLINRENRQRVVSINDTKSNRAKSFYLSISLYDKENSTYVIALSDITDIKMESQKFKYGATHDKLTSLYNRSYFENALKIEIEKFNKYKTQLSIILLDIDHFKYVNDNFGHLVGDKVLMTLALIIKNHFRINDISARWGGEEFIILLPNSTFLQAKKRALELKDIIEHTTFPEVKNITSSFGVTSITSKDSMQTLISRVDQALYKAKNRGRNCVVGIEELNS